MMVDLFEHKRPLPALIHFAAWTILFCIPLFFTGREAEALTVERYIRFVIVPLSFMLVFYMNYFLLVKRFLFARQPGHYILSNLLLIVAATLCVHFLMRLLPPPDHFHPRPEREWQEMVLFFLGNTLLYFLVAGLSVAIRMTGGWYEVESMRRELEKSHAEVELQNLKSQLNPHFLFNTLNNIYSLIAFSPERAQVAVHDLSRLLRYVLYESSQPLVPIEKDLDFVSNYVELMRIRLPKHAELKTDISASSPGLLIAPLLFISLIENAFKHGISQSKPSFIQLDIHQEGDLVICHIVNSYFPKDASQDKSGSGIGLSNLQKRLTLLYRDQCHFSYGREGDTYCSDLVITVNTPAL